MSDSSIFHPPATWPGPDRAWLADADKGAPGRPFQFLENLVRDFGDSVCFSSLYGPVYFFNHPDQVRQVLHNSNIVRAPLITLTLGHSILSSDGPPWRATRRLMQPQFHESCVRGFLPLINAGIERMLARWNMPEGGARSFDILHEMKLLTLDTIGHTMLGSDLSADAEEISEAISELVSDLGHITGLLLNSPMSVSPSRNARFERAVATTQRLVMPLIEARRALEERPRDLLTTLVEARDAQTGEPLSDAQLRDEVLTILFAGHETTAITLAWALHLLAQNPDAMHTLQAEADAVIGDRTPEVADLEALKWAEMVFQETMRLFPPVWIVVRRTVEADEISGVPIPAGAFVMISPLTTHRHRDLWPDASRFAPARFADGDGEKRALYTHYSFGGGRHLCLGARVATVEVQMILAMLARRFDFRALPNPPVVAQPVLTLRPQFGVPMSVERRR